MTVEDACISLTRIDSQNRTPDHQQIKVINQYHKEFDLIDIRLEDGIVYLEIE